MKTQSRTIHIGNQGESIVSQALARNCIIRDVAQGKDTGIDLYVEILDVSSLELDLHFFCQVKTQNRPFSLNSVDSKYFEYWAQQPVPVFLFSVEYFAENNIRDSSKIYIHDIPYCLAIQDARAMGKRLPVREMDIKFQLSDLSNGKDKITLTDFLYVHVPWSYSLWFMRKYGLVIPTPQKRSDNKYSLALGFSHLYKDKINDTFRHAETVLGIEYRSDED
jgi:hypothetical protein